MPNYEEGPQTPQQITPPLSSNESPPYVSRSLNLNQLIKLHRTRQKYQIVDKFFNNSYIMIENKLQPIEVYYQHDMLKSYLQDLRLVYFKQIEFSQNVRLQYILRRLNYTLNGEVYKFKDTLIQNQFYEQATSLFSEEYLECLQSEGNDKKVLDLRNTITLCLLIDQIHSFSLKKQQNLSILQNIYVIYNDINRMISSQDNQTLQFEKISPKDKNYAQKQEILGDSQNFDQSEQVWIDCDSVQSKVAQQYQSQKKFLFFFDMLYHEQMSLKIIQAELQTSYFSNQINDSNLNEQSKIKLQYLIQINRQLIQKTKELRQLNLSNRILVKKIQRNLQIELNSGIKCICINDSSNLTQCFGNMHKIHTIPHQTKIKLQKVIDADYTQKMLLSMIVKLKHKVIADAIEKVFEIQKEQTKTSLQLNLLFHVSFQYGLGISDAIFNQKDFLRLNDLRQQSTLTSYLTPMKSCYSYISHNIYTFLKIMNEDFPYDKSTNNNSSIMGQIRSKMVRQKVISRAGLKQFYHQNFKMCHNCKILCPKDFLKQCRKRIKYERYREQGQDQQDDSLYIQKNYNRKGSSQSTIQCQKSYCLYCLKNQFNGKIFNDKGWCPACLQDCHCNTCLRNRLLKKLVDFYLYVGGQPQYIKSQKDIINEMSVKGNQKTKQFIQSRQSSDSELDERQYESVIRRQISKGYSPAQIDLSLHRQSDILKMIVQRQKTKSKTISLQQNLFRQKISFLNDSFNYQELDCILQQQLKRKDELEKTATKNQQKSQNQIFQIEHPKRERRTVSKYSYKRKSRLIHRSDQIYYNYYKNGDEDSEEVSSSYHIRPKRSKEKQKYYEPDYDF